MVDHWLIAARNEAQDVVRGGEYDQQGDESDADAQSDLLRPFAQRTSEHGFAGIEDKMSAIQQRDRQKVHQPD